MTKLNVFKELKDQIGCL